MSYEEFLNRIIDDGIEAAKTDYCRPSQQNKLEGSIAGFEACRKKTAGQCHVEGVVVALADLLAEARKATLDAHMRREESEEYWRIRCYEAEVEWVCNCVSAVLINENRPCIIPPTARGVMKAAEIVGVR